MSHIQYIVNRRRSIFTDVEAIKSRAKGLDLLARACMHDLDIDVRMGIVGQWHQVGRRSRRPSGRRSGHPQAALQPRDAVEEALHQGASDA